MSQLSFADQKFISRLTEIILANLEKENFGVKDLAREAGMPQYSLNRKLQAINNKTINQFIREVRLEKANELLQNENQTVAEIAYRVGFSSPAYFNKCFHEYFGHPPGKAKIVGLEVQEAEHVSPDIITAEKSESKERRLWPVIFGLLVIVGAGIYLYPKFQKTSWAEDLMAEDGRISIAVMPFYNMTRDSSWNIWQGVIQECLISNLANIDELKVRQKESVNALLESRAITEYAALTPGIAGNISQKLDASLFIYGSIKRAGSILRVDVELTDTKTEEVVQSFMIEKPLNEDNIFPIIDTISLKVKNYLLISKLIKENPVWKHYGRPGSHSPEAVRYCMLGSDAFSKGDNKMAISWYQKAVAADSNYFDPMTGMSSAYANMGMLEQDYQWVMKYYNKREYFSLDEQLWASWAYATNFEPPVVAIHYLEQIKQIDDESPNTYYLIGITYNMIKQYSKAIPELEKFMDICRRWGKDFLKNNPGYGALGLAYHKTGQFKKEKAIYRLANKYNPDDPYIYGRQAILAYSEKDTVAAGRYFEKYIVVHRKSDPTGEAEISTTRGWIYDEAGYIDKAERSHREAIRMDPQNPQRLFNLAGLLVDHNRNLKDIQNLMDKAMVLSTNKVDYFKYLDMKGWGLYKQGKVTEALEILQKASDSAPFPIYTMTAHLQEVKKAVADAQRTATSN